MIAVTCGFGLPALLLPLVSGWILDRIFGDPPGLPHPMIWFGKMISGGEKRWNRGSRRVLKGGILSVSLIIGVLLTAALIIRMFGHADFYVSSVLYFLFATVCVFYCLAGTTLISEVRDVFLAADRSLEEGRRRVARIVGRDTSDLSLQEVRTAALETLAENLSDGVIAPLFWYMILGVPGMLAYKMVNTLDSMIGYKNERYGQFGRVAAKIDDVTNYIPARLTAFLMLVAAGKLKSFRFVIRYGRQHASPNSGYPESALAGILDCRFGGTHRYFGKEVYKPYIGENPRPIVAADMERAVKINSRSEMLMIVLVLAVQTFCLFYFE